MIRLTKQTDYGIVLLTYLASRPDERVGAAALAQATHLPQPMVSKILKLLAREGLLLSQRGVKGGYQLSRPAEEISVAEAIGALEGPIAITDCIEDGPAECSYESSCRIRGNWQVINQAVKEALQRIRLSDMALPGISLSQLTETPLVHLGTDGQP